MTAPNLYVISGAGLSAESGVPTFRTAGGLWERYDMARVCNALTWKAHRDEVFGFYRECRLQVAPLTPNDGHRVLACLQQRFGPERVRLLTQNVDDLLERAGALEVTHLHGDLARLYCTACGLQYNVSDADYLPTTRCPKCGSLKGVKPAVVFFGEAAPQYVHLSRMRKNLRAQDIVLVVGSSMQVIGPESFLPASRRGDERNFQVNPEPAETAWFGRVVPCGAVEGLRQLEVQLAQILGEGA